MVCAVSRSLRSLNADFVNPQHRNFIKFKIWHGKRMVWLVNTAPTVRFDSAGSVAVVVGADAQLFGDTIFRSEC